MVRDISGLDRLRTFVHSFGPAWVVMIADVDAASILTAAADGALYGYSLVWFLLLLVSVVLDSGGCWKDRGRDG